MKLLIRNTTLAGLTAAILAAAPGLAQACAMCGLAPGDHEAHAFNSSVLFMLSAPYLITAGVVLGLYRIYKRRPRSNQTLPGRE